MTSRSLVQILVADSNLMGCHLLSQALEQQTDFRVVATVVEAGALAHSLRAYSPDVALIGVHLQDGPRVPHTAPALECAGLYSFTDHRPLTTVFRCTTKDGGWNQHY